MDIDLTTGAGWLYLLQNIILPIGITFIISWVIGLERQNIGKAAGISPHVLIAITACSVALMQKELTGDQSTRVIAQLVTGIGFLGGGVIMKSDKTVKGLTTATTIFAVAMTGLIIGTGYYALGITLGVFTILFMYLRDVFRRLNPFNSRKVWEEYDDE